MKIAIICLLLLALLSGGYGVLIANGHSHLVIAGNEEVVAYVVKTEKEGFQPKEFEKFAQATKERRKNVILQPAAAQACQRVSLLFITLSAGLVFFRWPRK